MEIRTETEINATAQEVWEVLADLKRYPEWNPFTYEALGELKMGAEIKLKVRFPDGSEMRTRHYVCALEPNKELSWNHTNIPLLMWSERRQIIEPIDATRVRLVNREFIWGALAPLAVWLYGTRIAGGMRMSAEAIQAQVKKGG